MKQKDLFSYVYDFISLYLEKEGAERIRQIILFGSVARNEFDEKSDIDLFIDVAHDVKKVEKVVRSALNSFQTRIDKIWKPKGILLPIKPIIGNLEEDKWKELKKEFISNGLVLYGEFKELPKNLNHFYLIEYSLTELERKNKMKILRILYGYRAIKGKKEYKQEGLLKDINGIRAGINTILIPAAKLKELISHLESINIRYKLKEIWIKI